MIFPPAEWRCTECGAVFTNSQVEHQDRFWIKNPRGPFHSGSDPHGPSYDQICPGPTGCGMENSLEPYHGDENDPLDVDDVAQHSPRTGVGPEFAIRAERASQPAGALRRAATGPSGRTREGR